MDKYGLIGYPLGHSFSINYFNQKFADEGINAKYMNFEIPTIEALAEVLDQNPELKGLNVTIPYKQKVMEFLDQISPEARAGVGVWREAFGALQYLCAARTEGGKRFLAQA